MINAEKKIVKEVKVDKKNVIKNTNSPPKKKISMPKLTNKDNNTVHNTLNSTPTKQRNSLKSDKSFTKINDRYSSTSSNEGTNITINTNNNTNDTNSGSGRSNTSNPNSHNNTIGNNNNSSSNLTSVIGNYLNNNTNEKKSNNSKTPNLNQKQNLDLKNNNSKNELNIEKNESKINNNPTQIKSIIPPHPKQEINKKNENIKNQNNQNPISNPPKINKSNSIIISNNSNILNNQKEEEKKIVKSNSQLNLPQTQNINQTKNPLSNTQIQTASTFKQIFNAPKMFNYEDDDNPNNKSVLSDIGGFFSNQFSSIRKSFFKRRDISKENYFNDFCNNIFVLSQYKNQIKKNFYRRISEKLRGKVWLKCLRNKFSITEDYFNIELEKAEKLKIQLKLIIKFNLPFKYLRLFKESSPLTKD
jgi:hypothetical protein